jgi:hypothetical protein
VLEGQRPADLGLTQEQRMLSRALGRSIRQNLKTGEGRLSDVATARKECSMCGIWGVSYGKEGPGAEELTPQQMADLMFPAIVHRGPHALGIMYCTTEGEVFYTKMPGRSDDPDNYQAFIIPDDIKWMVGHVRYATHGDPSDNRNNHPLQHGNIIGVHNGVLRNHESILGVTGREVAGTKVDSEAIFAAVDHYGHKKGLNKIKGDMVTVYTNVTKPYTLHLARTDGRPLMICNTPGGAKVFASETGVMKAMGVELSDPSPLSKYRLIRIRDGKIFERIDLDAPKPVQVPVQHGRTTRSDAEAFTVRQRAEAAERAARRGKSLWQGAMSGNYVNQNQKVRKDYEDGPIPICTMAVEDAIKAGRLERDLTDPNTQDHDILGEFYFYQGRLRSPDEYVRMIAIEIGEEA